MRRHLILPPKGTLLINTDLHGNFDDFRKMGQRFEASPKDTHWVILGDIVHGPSPLARAQRPELYDYEDESGKIAVAILKAQKRYRGRIHFVLGNHDWAHIGGPNVGKFWPNEAAYLESWLEPKTVQAMHLLFRRALLCVIAPCGALLSHASPAVAPTSLEELDAIELGEDLTQRQLELVHTHTKPYAQAAITCNNYLREMSLLSGQRLVMVVQGHDRHESGCIVREGTQVVPVIFGAPKRNKSILKLDLAHQYESAMDLRDNVEVLKLWY